MLLIAFGGVDKLSFGVELVGTSLEPVWNLMESMIFDTLL